MSKHEREAYFPQFYEEDKAVIDAYAKKYPKYQDDAQKLLISLEADKYIRRMEYEKALAQIHSLSMKTHWIPFV